jgi:hypothetical protein
VFFLLIAPVLTLGLSLAIGRIAFSWPLLTRLALGYLLMGGLIFFFSALLRGDWLFGLLVFVMQRVLFTLKKNGVDLSAVWDFVVTVLPPFQHTDIQGPIPRGPALYHVLLYGGGLVLAGLVILRLRPLGSGGRS